jgi:hypothetical protein
MNALWQSSGQEFKSDVDAIQLLAKEVKAEIKLTKAYIDDVERMLQERDRLAASEQRRTLGRFMPKVEKDLESINRLQLQQSTRRSSMSPLFVKREEADKICRKEKTRASRISVLI